MGSRTVLCSMLRKGSGCVAGIALSAKRGEGSDPVFISLLSAAFLFRELSGRSVRLQVEVYVQRNCSSLHPISFCGAVSVLTLERQVKCSGCSVS